MARTYSVALMLGQLGTASVPISLTRTVPAGHTWVVRHVAAISRVAPPNGVRWTVTLAGAQIPGGFAVTVPIAGGSSASEWVPSEWQGTVVCPAGYVLAFTSLPLYTASGDACSFMVSGYDLID